MEGHMNKYSQLIVGFALIAVLLSACGTNAPAVNGSPSAPPAAITVTPDPCASENIEAEVNKIYKFMREFDDASSLAASRPREELADAIAELQRIRRAADPRRGDDPHQPGAGNPG